SRGLGVTSAPWRLPTQSSRTRRLTSRLYSAPAHPRRQRSCLILVKPLRLLLALACIASRAQPSVRRRTAGGQTYCPTSLAIRVISTVFSVPSPSFPSLIHA